LKRFGASSISSTAAQANMLGLCAKHGESLEVAVTRAIEFYRVYRMYRVMHPPGYALERAWQIAFMGLPF